MKGQTTLLFLIVSFVAKSTSEHLISGNINNNKHLIHHTIVQYHAIPFMKRVKNVFFNSPNQSIINSIMAYDNLHTNASATITAGGLGHTYVNLRLKSERGKGLEYDIGIYA